MMGVPPKRKNAAARGGRKATTVAILDAAEERFAADGYDAVTVRAIAERAGVSHALVHRYLGTKAEIFRAVLSRNQGVMLAAAPDDLDILTAVSLILREGLIRRRRYVRLLADSALHGVPYAQTPGRFAAVEKLVELAEQVVASASPDARTGDDLDPRFVIAAITALFLGWGATESWVLPAAGIGDMDEAAAIDALERVMWGILRSNLPGLDGEEPATD